MPTYRNKNGTPKQFGGQTFNGGEIKKILSWPTGRLDNGIEMLDEMPMYNPTLICEKVVETKTVYIPEGESRFAIHFYAEKGEPVIYYNSRDNKPSLKLYEGAKWNERVYERVIDKLIVELSEGSSLWIIAERT